MILGILFIFLFSISVLSWNFIVKDSQKISTVIIGQIISGIIFSSLLYFLWKDIKTILPHYIYAMPLGFFCALEFWATNLVYKKGEDVSFVVPVKSALGVLFVAILSGILSPFIKSYKSPTLLCIIGCLVVLIGILIIPFGSISKIKIQNYINNKTSILGLIAFSELMEDLIFSILLLKLPTDLDPLHSIILILIPMRYVSSLFLLLFYCLHKLKIKEKMTIELVDVKKGIIMGCFISLAMVFSGLGIHFIQYANLVTVITKIGIPISIFGGWLVFKEKVYWGKLIGAIVIIIGVGIIALT